MFSDSRLAVCLSVCSSSIGGGYEVCLAVFFCCRCLYCVLPRHCAEGRCDVGSAQVALCGACVRLPIIQGQKQIYTPVTSRTHQSHNYHDTHALVGYSSLYNHSRRHELTFSSKTRLQGLSAGQTNQSQDQCSALSITYKPSIFYFTPI